jgi:hypothetical protein
LHNANDLEVFDAFQRSLLNSTDDLSKVFFHFQLALSICLLPHNVYAFDIPASTPEWASYFKN